MFTDYILQPMIHMYVLCVYMYVRVAYNYMPYKCMYMQIDVYL